MLVHKYLIVAWLTALLSFTPLGVSAEWGFQSLLHPHNTGKTADPAKARSIHDIIADDSWNQPIGGGRKLVVCVDGTWQHPGSPSDVPSQGGIKVNAAMVPSNIVKLAYLVGNGKNENDQDPSTLSQRVYYHAGVATEVGDKNVADLEGNFGNIHEHLLDAYAWLAREYREGDEIYAFGFSRGSTIVRSLFSFINYAGLAKSDNADTHDSLMIETRDLPESTEHAIKRAEFHKKHCHHHVLLKFIGVFDTVEALDVPEGYSAYLDSSYLTAIEESMGAIEPNNYHDLRIGTKPTMFEALDDATDELPAHFVREQKWFRGAHADIGGGWWEQGLSEIPLRWMVDNARAAGLRVQDVDAFDARFNPLLLGEYPSGESPNGKRIPRDLTKLMDTSKFYKSSLHESVFALAGELKPSVPENVKALGQQV
ncbi:hypothetical protein BDR26DRAFT_1014834 [Obelidium mucronatum]|nr:hypothetical protein BDR26DRAFT_1014834 [Obelidium mucronatum]